MIHLRETRTDWMRAIAGLLTLAIITGNAKAVDLAPGDCVDLDGTTLADRPELAGTVIYDQLTDFEIRDGDGGLVYAGQLQNRVVRSDLTGTLHFYYRVRDTDPTGYGSICTVITFDFTDVETDVDWREDGLGTVGPYRACRMAWGEEDLVKFDFLLSEPLMPGEESRFMFIATDATSFAEVGRTQLRSNYFGSEYIVTAMPILFVWAGDLDGDGDVDLNDLAQLLAAYGACLGDPDYDDAADIDESGCVDLSDLAALLADYGEGP